MTEERMKEVALALLRTFPQMLSTCPRAMFKQAAEKHAISVDELGEFAMTLFLQAIDEIAAEEESAIAQIEQPTAERIAEVSRIMNACPDNDIVKIAEFAEAHGVSFDEMKACIKAVAKSVGLKSEQPT